MSLLDLSLPNVDTSLFDTPTGARLGCASASTHPPRFLLLYGSLRERSYSKLMTLEAARLLIAMGGEVRVFDPAGLPLPDSAPDTHPKVQELRKAAAWAEGMVWTSPERHGAMTGIMKAQIDWIPLSIGAVRPTQGKTLAVMQVSGGSQSFNAVNQLRVLGRWMRMITIPNQSSVAKAFLEFDEAGRMKPSAYYERVVDVMEELVKFTLLTRDLAPYLVDRYSERKESVAALSRRIDQRAMTPLRIPAVYMRGGTSKGVFFLADDLPEDPAQRDAILLRVVGSPDRYGKHIDGMGGATSSTSKVVLISRSSRPGHDVDYLFGAVALDQPVIDWSGNCGNLTSAVGPFAISQGLVSAPAEGWAPVRIWQANIGKTIVARVPMRGGEVQEDGDFELDGVSFPSAEIRLEFMDPGADEGDGEAGAMFPTGRRLEAIQVDGLGAVEVTLINAGNPTIFVDAETLGLTGTELQSDVNANADLLRRAEAIRAQGAVAMGLAVTPAEATARRPHTPKLAFVARPARCMTSDGRTLEASSIDLLVRIFSMGQLHHAMTGTGAVAIAVAAAIPGTLVHRVAPLDAQGRVRFGHPSGSLSVGAEAVESGGEWTVTKVVMSRSARRLMEGWVRVPAD